MADKRVFEVGGQSLHKFTSPQVGTQCTPVLAQLVLIISEDTIDVDK